MKVEPVWQFQFTTNEKISLENVYDMTQKAMAASDYESLPNKVKEIISNLAQAASDIVENSVEI